MLYAGFAREVITPALGTFLFGYRPGIDARAVNDDIHVNALYLQDGDEKVIILNAEVCLIENNLCNSLRQEIADKTGIAVDHIIVSATHTHSAPNLVGMAGWGGIDLDYFNDIFLPATLKAVSRAVAESVAVKLGIARGESHIGMNRRQIDEDSNISLGQNPWGPYDPKMIIFSLVRADNDKQLVNVVHYTCHGTCAGCNHEVTRDWSGAMIDALEKEFGGMAFFMNGASGDVGPRLSNGKTTGEKFVDGKKMGDVRFVAELGAKAAKDAVRVRTTITEYKTDAKLSVITGNVTLAFRPVPSEKDLIVRLDEILAKTPDPSKLVNLAYMEYNYIINMLNMYKEKKKLDKSYTFLQTIIAVDGVAIVPIPFELFSTIARRLDHYSPFDDTLVLSNSNGANVYMPNKEEICRGGYEVGCFRYGRDQGFDDDSDTAIIKQNLALLNELYKKENK